MSVTADPAPSSRPQPDLDDIVYRISHDLRASVRALQELPNWLREDLIDQRIELTGEPGRTLDLLQSHARRLDEMLNGLLAYSRVGRLQEIRMCQPQDVFEDVVKELRPGEDVTFFSQFNPVSLRIGTSDVARVFQILVSNAIRHNSVDAKQVEVISCRSGALWELMVSDNGPGIPEASRDEVFRPMVKLVSRDEDEGGGMGLAILRKITDVYGGTVEVEPRKRRGGTTFRVRLPVVA